MLTLFLVLHNKESSSYRGNKISIETCFIYKERQKDSGFVTYSVMVQMAEGQKKVKHLNSRNLSSLYSSITLGAIASLFPAASETKAPEFHSAEFCNVFLTTDHS